MVPHLNIFLPWSCLILISSCLLWNLGVWFQNLGSCFQGKYCAQFIPPSDWLALSYHVFIIYTLHKSSLLCLWPCPDFECLIMTSYFAQILTIQYFTLSWFHGKYFDIQLRVSNPDIRVHNLHKSSLLT